MYISQIFVENILEKFVGTVPEPQFSVADTKRIEAKYGPEGLAAAKKALKKKAKKGGLWVVKKFATKR